MEKYWVVFKNTIGEYFAYRLNFIMWRVRTVFQLLTIYFLWWAIFQSRQEEIFGYSQKLILTYILGVSLLRAVVFASRTVDVGEQISRGDLTNFLLRPISYLKYWFTRDLADKVLNIFCAVFEVTLIFWLLRPSIMIQTNFLLLFLFLASAILALVLFFYINFLFGLLGFWTPEVWAPRFVFFIFIEFLAGGLFPLDILPKLLYETLQLLPFSYLLFFPLKIYLGQLSNLQILEGFTVGFFWVLIFYQIVKLVWHRGLLIYSAEGR